LQVAKPPVEKLPPEPPSLQLFASMDPQMLAASIVQLRKKLEQESTLPLGAPPSESVVRAISQKLSVISPSTPQYWPTVAAMITYQSWLATGRQVNLLVINNLKNCVRVGGVAFPIRGAHFNLADPSGRFQGCIVTLDNANLIDSTIENAIIVFKGSPTKLQNVRFVNCLFAVTLTDDTFGPARSVASALLSASNGTVVITTPAA
jgi:hypothetical protein